MNRSFKPYPLLFQPNLKPTIWGGKNLYKIKGLPEGEEPVGESWEISALVSMPSVVSNGELKGKSLPEIITLYGEQIPGKKVWMQYGEHFPLLIKFIDTRRDLSVQVHPDDRMAQLQNFPSGKEEMWYIMHTEQDSRLLFGFNRAIDKKILHTYIRDEKLTDILHSEKVAPGEVYHIPPGRVHAIGGGILLAEIQQSSDITYRLYDWGRGRTLHIDRARDVIDYSVSSSFKTPYLLKKNSLNEVIHCPHFLTDIAEITADINLRTGGDSFQIIINVSGATAIRYDHGEILLPYAHSTLIPASLGEFQVANMNKTGSSKILRVRV